MSEKLSNMSFISSTIPSYYPHPNLSPSYHSHHSLMLILEFSRRDKHTKTLLPFASVKQDEQHININTGVFMKDWKSCPSGGQVTFEFSPPAWKVIRHGQADGRPFLTLENALVLKYTQNSDIIFSALIYRSVVWGCFISLQNKNIWSVDKCKKLTSKFCV